MKTVKTLVTVRLANISVWGHHGVDESEKKNGGPFLVSLELSYPDTHSDDIAAHPDYAAITNRAVELFQGQRFNLIESLAGVIADAILSEFSGLASVTVTVRKLRPLMPHVLDYVEAAITHRQE